MEKGRYTHYSTRKLPEGRRARILPGSFEDRGKYARCPRCGFPVNLDRDAGDPEQSGSYETDMIVAAQTPVGSGTNPIILMDTLDMAGICLENGKDGNAATDFYSPRVHQVSSGCPVCGCTAF